MEQGIRAFFYRFQYYLFPEGMELSDLAAAGRVEVKRLKEERCMAPDFIYESMEDAVVAIDDPALLFEVRVNLYTGAEYDAILAKHVDRICPGCVRYTDDDGFEGFHSEMSLDGVCFLREDKDEPWSFGFCVWFFWHRMAERLNELAACIDGGDMQRLNAILNEDLERFYVPLNFFGTVRDGRYCLYVHGDWRTSPVSYAAERYLAECAMVSSPLPAAGWTVRYQLPAGLLPHKSAFFDEKKMGYVEEAEAGRVVVHLPPCKEEENEARLDDFYACMAEDIGEYEALCAIGSVEFDAQAGLMPRKAIAKKLAASAQAFIENFGGDGTEASPYAVAYGYNGEDAAQQLPYRERLQEGFTQSPDVSLIDRTALEGEAPWWTAFGAFAYLYVPREAQGDEEALRVLMWHLQYSKDAPVRREGEDVASAINLGFAFGEGCFFLDMLLADEKAFHRTLRILAPVLRAYDAKVVFVSAQGVMVYQCGYDLLPAQENT